MRLNFGFLFLLGILLSGCVLNTTSRMPKGEYLSLSGTPLLIEKIHRFDPATADADIAACRDGSERVVVMQSRVIKITGGSTAVFFGAMALGAAATGGLLAPLFVGSAASVAATGGLLFLTADATDEFREFSMLEHCLEEKGYNVLLYKARKSAPAS